MKGTLHRRYRIVGPIGQGGMGSVSLADDLRLPGRQCAVKVLRPPEGADAATIEALQARFHHEALLLARLDHPALPRVTDHFMIGDESFLVMDYVAGNDLRSILNTALSRGRCLDEDQVLAWAEQLCDALGYLHRQVPPIIHRDVKPANIKLTPDGQIRLVDFGLAQVPLGPDGPTVTHLAGGGSRGYQPLEQYGDGSGVDARSDVYALGATLYHLLVGQPPPSAEDRFLDPARFRRPRALRPDLSEPVALAIERALALHPDQRPPSMEDFRRLLVAQAEVTGEAWAMALQRNAWLIAIALTMFLLAAALTLRP